MTDKITMACPPVRTMGDVKREMTAAVSAIGAGYRGTEVEMIEYPCPKCGATHLRREYKRWTTKRGWPQSSTTITCVAEGCDHRSYYG